MSNFPSDSSGFEVLVDVAYVFTLLTEDATVQRLLGADGQVYDDMLPPEVTFPYILVSHRHNADTMTWNGHRVMNVATMQIKAVDRVSSYVPKLMPLMSRVDSLLHRSSGTLALGTVFQVNRQSIYKFSEILEGVEHRHLGGIYRFWTKGSLA